MKFKFFIPLFLFLFFLSSCGQIDFYERNTSIPSFRWKADTKITGSFDITDTLSYYNIYVVLRHTDAYKYNNIWLNVGWKTPGDTLRMQKVELVLGHDATGWEGMGMNDIWEVRKRLNIQPQRFRKGTFQYSLSHIMRDEPLEQVMSVGLRVEKTELIEN